MDFYKEIPIKLERQNIKINKYKNLTEHSYRIPSKQWNRSVSNNKSILLTELNQVNAGEVRDQDTYFLLLLPKEAYVVFIVDSDNINKKWIGKYMEPYSFEHYDIDYVNTILDFAMYAMNERNLTMKEKY